MRQADALLEPEGRHEKTSLKLAEDHSDELGTLLKKWQKRLTLKSLNIGDRYIDGTINLIVVVIAADGKHHRAFIRRAPNGETERHASGFSRTNIHWPVKADGVTDRGEMSVHLLSPELVQCPQSRALPSFVGFHSTDFKDGTWGRFLYFSLSDRGFKITDAPSNGELDSCWITFIENDQLAGEIIKGSSQVGHDISNEPLNVGGNFVNEPNSYKFVSGLRVDLFENFIRVTPTEGLDLGCKLGDIAIGPFNL